MRRRPAAHRGRDHHRRARPHPRRHQQEGRRRALRRCRSSSTRRCGPTWSRGSPALRRGRRSRATASQAEVPRGATVLRNRWGTAPGLWLEGAARPRDHAARACRARCASCWSTRWCPGWRRAPAARSIRSLRRAHDRHPRVHPGRADGRDRARDRPAHPGVPAGHSTGWTCGSPPGVWSRPRRTRGCARRPTC